VAEFIENFKEYLSTDTFVAGGGVAGGMIAGDITGNGVASKLGYTGDKALVVSGITKVATGGVLYSIGASLREGVWRSVLRYAGIGAAASIVLDLIDRIFPQALASSAALKARMKTRSAARTAASRPVTRVIKPPRGRPVQVEVEKAAPESLPEAKSQIQFM